MSDFLAKSIIGLMPREDCLRAVCVPQSVGAGFVDQLVNEGNKVRPPSILKGGTPHCIRLVPDHVLSPNLPFVSAGQAADYRTNSRLFVWRDGDFQPDSSFATAVPYVIPPGFPANTAHGVTVIQLAEAFVEAARHLMAGKLAPHEENLFADAVREVVNFLQETFEILGNQDIDWNVGWWQAIQSFFNTVAQRLSLSAPGDFRAVGDVYACAGLPVPNGLKAIYQKLKPEGYATILDERYSSQETAEETLAWLQAKGSNIGILRLPWKELAKEIQSRGHTASAVTRLGESNFEKWFKAWRDTPEDQFINLLELAGGKGTILVEWKNKTLPAVGADTSLLPTRDARWDFPAARELELSFDDTTFIVPWRPGLTGAEIADGAVPEVVFRPKAGWDFRYKTAKRTDRGLEVTGTVSFHAKTGSKWPAKAVTIGCERVEGLLGHLNTDATCKVVLPSPWGTSAFVSHGDRSKKLFVGAGGKLGIKSKRCAAADELDAFELALKLECGAEVYSYDGRQEHAGTSKDASGFTIGRATSVPWNDCGWTGASCVQQVRLTNGLEVREAPDGRELVSIVVSEDQPHPWLPLAATALGTTPSDAPPSHEMANRLRAHLENLWVSELSKLPMLGPDSMVYCVLPTTSPDVLRSQRVAGHHFVHWLMAPAGGYELEIENAGRGPSQALVEMEEFGKLFKALDDLIKALETSGNGGRNVWPSRWQLKDLDRQLVDAYLDAYVNLVQKAKSLDNQDLFWASYPFSAIVYSTTEAKVTAVLLSPLHPLRLGWLYGAERALVEGEVPINPSRREISQLLEGWSFPYVGPGPSYGSPVTLAATPIDTGPEQLFIGWSALVHFDNNNGSQLQLPAFGAGWRLPGGSTSGLNQGGVGAAIRDFMRVYPHLPTLTMELFASAPAPRSTELDMAVMNELARVAADEADAVPLPQSLKVLDSDFRQGPPPKRDDVFDALAAASDGNMPSFEWRVYRGHEAAKIAADIRMVEDAQARIAVAKGEGQILGSFGNWPTRRFIGRQPVGKNHDVHLHYLIDPAKQQWRMFALALQAMEKLPFVTTDAIRVRPSQVLLGTSGLAQWVVTGNVLVDPGAISRAAANFANGPSILWEWRPPFLPRRKTNAATLDFGRRPYMTIAKVPEPFRNRIAQLRGLNSETTKQMLQTLGRRGIGLASLLAMGDNHAEGALGFYLALRVLDSARKVLEKPERRMFVVPLDAVNNLLVAIGGDKDGTSRRADLLVVLIDSEDEEHFNVTLLPVEVRCCGFANNETAASFPAPASSAVRNKVEQLRETHRCLKSVLEAVAPSGKRDVTIDGTAMGAVVETAFLTTDGPHDHVFAAKCISAIASGKSAYKMAAGLLLWFQVTGMDGGPDHLWFPPSASDPFGCLFIDPTTSKKMWEGEVAELGYWPSKAMEDCAQQIVQYTKVGQAAENTAPIATKLADKLPPESASSTEARGISLIVTEAIPNSGPISKPVIAEPIPQPSHVALPMPTPVERPRVYVGPSTGYRDGVWWDPSLPAKRLTNSHVVILGSAGSGKTQVLSSFILEMHRQGIPSLILDFKDDYSKPSFRDVVGARLFDATDGLPVNPLALPVDELTGKVNPTQQVFTISGIFDAVYNLGDIQEPHLREAISKTYEQAGIPRNPGKLPAGVKVPQFADVKKALEEIDDKSLNARLSSIFDLGLFREGEFTVDDLLSSTSVLRFTQLPSEQVKKAAGGIVLRAVYNALLKRGHVQGLRLALIIDEAHRIANLEPVKLLVKEARAYGVGVFLSSQEARDFDDFVFSNAGTLLTLKLSETTDADRVAKLLVGNSEYKGVSEQLRNCDQFEGFFRNDQYKPYARMKVQPFYERIRK